MSSIFKSGLAFFDNFAEAFESLISASDCQQYFDRYGPRRGGAAKLSYWQWLMSRVYHVMAKAGSFSTHVKQVTGVSVSDSALSQRGQSIGWKLVAELLPEVLEPLADAEKHPDAFYDGMRLLGLDGTRHNLRNTEAINAEALKIRCNRGSGEPAFAQLISVVLLELGTHQPLGAALGWQGKGELTLARELIEAQGLPPNSLLLGDRLFGTPSLIHVLQPMAEATGSHWLLRVKSNLKAKREKRLKDGSWLVSIRVTQRSTKRCIATIMVREIYAEIRTCKGGAPMKLRFWTSLLDAGLHPASQLVELYDKRWEHELFFRELKSHLHGRNNLLDGQTPETAAEEVLAMLLAASLIAQQRAAVAEAAGVEIRRVKYSQVLEQTIALCQVFEIGHDLIGKAARVEWTRRVLDQLASTATIPKRAPRSCQRGLRQPAKDWPKIRKPSSKPLTKIISISNP